MSLLLHFLHMLPSPGDFMGGIYVMAVLVPSPFGPVATRFYLDNSPRAALVGPWASGKSVTVVFRMLRHIMAQPVGNDGVARSRWLVLRNTYRSLKDSAVRTWREWVDDETWGAYEETKSQHVLSGEVGGKRIHTEVLFRALDDPADVRNVLGLELSGVWVNEAREIDRQVFGAILNRCGRYPAIASGTGPAWHGALLDSNPWATTHFLHTMFVTDPQPGFTLFRQPGGLHEDAEGLSNLRQTPELLALPFDHPKRRDAGRQTYRDMQASTEPAFFRVNGMAEWGQLTDDSAVFPDYNDQIHCRAFDLPANPIFTLGLDPGLRGGGAALIHRTPTGQCQVADEVAAFDVDIAGFVRRLREMIARYPGAVVERTAIDPAASHRDLSGVSGLQLLRNLGITAIPARTNDPRRRILAVGQLLRSMQRDGSPTFLLHPRCKYLRRGFLGDFRFRTMQAGTVGETILKNEVSHPHDALAYGLLAMGDLRQRAVQWPTDSDGNLMVVHPRGTWTP